MVDEKTPLKNGFYKVMKRQTPVLKLFKLITSGNALKNPFFNKSSPQSPHKLDRDFKEQQKEEEEDEDANQKTSLLPEWEGDKRSKRTVPPLVIMHSSAFKTAWDWFALILVLYTAVFTPFMAAFSGRSSNKTSSILNDVTGNVSNTSSVYNLYFVPKNVPQNMSLEGDNISNDYDHILATTPLASDEEEFGTCLYVNKPSKNELVFMEALNEMEVFVDIMFVTDILINFRTTYIEDGELVTQPRKIALNYMKSWFLIDAVAAMPFDWLIYRTGSSDFTLTQGLTGILKTARLLRLLRVARKIDQYSEYGAAVLILLMATFTLIAHWLACLFYAITTFERSRVLQAPISWMDFLAKQKGLNCRQNLDTKSLYVTSLYFTFTILTSVGFGNIAPVTNYEKVFTIFVMLLGSLMSAAIFGNVSSIMLRLYKGTQQYHEMVASIREFIKCYFFPKHLANKLLESHQNSRSFINALETDSVFTSFPECLQSEICLHLHRDLLDQFKVFKDISPACLRLFSMKVKTLHVLPTESLLHPGDLLNCAFFVTKGMLEVLDDDLLVAILGKGDMFGSGSNCKWSKQCSFHLKAMSASTVHKILTSDLEEVTRDHADFKESFEKHFSVTFDLHALEKRQKTKRIKKYHKKDFSYSNDTYQAESKSSENTLHSLENLPFHPSNNIHPFNHPSNNVHPSMHPSDPHSSTNEPSIHPSVFEGINELKRRDGLMRKRNEMFKRKMVEEEEEKSELNGEKYLETVKLRLNFIGKRLGTFESDLCSLIDSISCCLES